MSVEGREGVGVSVDCARKARAMIFTLHVNQELSIDGEALGAAPVEGVADAESVVQLLPHKYLVYGREWRQRPGPFISKATSSLRAPWRFGQSTRS